MDTIKKLLDATKIALNVESDYALAKALDIHKARISAYYAGKEAPNEFACLQIAEALKMDYGRVQALVRIETEKDEQRRNLWLDYFKRIGGLAASFALAFLVNVTLIVTSPPAEAAPALKVPAERLCIMLNRLLKLCKELKLRLIRFHAEISTSIVQV